MKIDMLATLDKTYGLREKNNSRKLALDKSDDSATEKVKKGDSLEISSNLRKIQQIKSRVESGVYNDDRVINEVARRLIEYTDL
jgi:anti-sigma28 factor (negative regulator of flagellin synthesis)